MINVVLDIEDEEKFNTMRTVDDDGGLRALVELMRSCPLSPDSVELFECGHGEIEESPYDCWEDAWAEGVCGDPSVEFLDGEALRFLV